jgi:hypothetical protein
VIDSSFSGFEKTAAPIKEYILKLTPQPGKTLLHVIALGSYEYYGPNRNKDAFAEHHHGPKAQVNLPQCAIDDEYGGLLDQFKGMKLYEDQKVFETFRDAHAFQHHKNKDPNKRIGDVVKAFYNPEMHRVELVISLDHDRCPPKYIDRVNSGAMLAFSMGCHIKFDVCSVCGNKAPTREHYCNHAKRMHRPGHEFDDSGRPVCVFNPNARFFDISIVFRPADRIGYMLKKIAGDDYEGSAEKGEEVVKYNYKRALANKLGDMDKRISGSVEEVVQIPSHMEVALKALPEMPEHDVDFDRLAEHPFADVVKSASAEGVMFSASEIAVLLANKWQGGCNTAHVKLASRYAATAMAALAESPDVVDEIIDSGLFDGRYSPKLANDVAYLKALRGCDRESLLKQAFLGGHKSPLGTEDVGWRKHAPAGTDRIEVPDSDGDPHITNRTAVNSAAKDQRLKSLAKALAAGLLVGGSYRMLAGSGGLGSGLLGAGGSALYDWLGNNRVLPFGDHHRSSAGPVSNETLLFKRGEELKVLKTGMLEKMHGGSTESIDLGVSDGSFNKLSEVLSSYVLRDLLDDGN